MGYEKKGASKIVSTPERRKINRTNLLKAAAGKISDMENKAEVVIYFFKQKSKQIENN